MAGKSQYTEERAEAICNMIAEGMSLRQIAAVDGMPDKTTVLRWLSQHETFRAQYARAREVQAEHFSDEILEISDDGSNDWMERSGPDGQKVTVLNGEHVQRSRLRVDSRKWLMSKLAPKKYGDKLQHSGADGEGPVKMEITWANDPSES